MPACVHRCHAVPSTVSLDKVCTRINLMQSSLHWLLQRRANGSLSASFASGFAHGAHRAANVLEGAPGNTNESAHGGFTSSVPCPTQASVPEGRHPGRREQCHRPNAPSAHPLCAAVRVQAQRLSHTVEAAIELREQRGLVRHACDDACEVRQLRTSVGLRCLDVVGDASAMWGCNRTACEAVPVWYRTAPFRAPRPYGSATHASSPLYRT